MGKDRQIGSIHDRPEGEIVPYLGEAKIHYHSPRDPIFPIFYWVGRGGCTIISRNATIWNRDISHWRAQHHLAAAIVSIPVVLFKI
jgi:hypothetical protein